MRFYNSIWFLEYLPAFVLAIVFFVIWKTRRSPLNHRAIPAIILIVAIQVLTQFGRFLWIYADTYRFEILRQFLPPVGTVYFTQMQHAFQSITVGWVFAGVTALVLYFVFLRRGGQMLDHDDLMLLTLGVGAVGWPAGFILFTITFFFSVLAMIVNIVRRKKTLADRLIITPYIIPAVLVTLLAKVPLLEWTHLGKIRF